MKHKKIITTLGMIAAPLPIMTVVSCSGFMAGDKSDKDDTTNTGSTITGTGNNQSNNHNTVNGPTPTTVTAEGKLSKIPRRPIALKQATYYVKGDFEGFDMNALDALRQLRNNENNIDWHVTGDNLVDAINDWRYAIWKAANGDRTAAIELSKIVKSADFYGYNRMNNKVASGSLANAQSTTLTPSNGSGSVPSGASNFAEAAKRSMKQFIDTQNPNKLRVSFDGSLGGKAWPGPDYSTYPAYADMNPVVITNKMLGWAEYRSQQIDWRGSFDNHSWTTSNSDIESATRPDSTKPDWADAPQEMKNNPNSGENYGAVPLIKGEVDIPKSISLYEGQAVAFGFIIDDRDATGTLGHRANTLNPDYKSVGWSLDVTSDHNDPNDATNEGYVVAVNIQWSSELSNLKKSSVDDSWLSIYDSVNNRGRSYENTCALLDQYVPNLRDAVDPLLAASVVDKNAIITTINGILNNSGITSGGNTITFTASDVSTSRNTAENLYATFTDEKVLESPVDGKTTETEVRDVLGSGLLVLTI